MSARGTSVNEVRVVDEHGAVLRPEVRLVRDGERVDFTSSNGRPTLLVDVDGPQVSVAAVRDAEIFSYTETGGVLTLEGKFGKQPGNVIEQEEGAAQSASVESLKKVLEGASDLLAFNTLSLALVDGAADMSGSGTSMGGSQDNLFAPQSPSSRLKGAAGFSGARQQFKMKP